MPWLNFILKTPTSSTPFYLAKTNFLVTKRNRIYTFPIFILKLLHLHLAQLQLAREMAKKKIWIENLGTWNLTWAMTQTHRLIHTFNQGKEGVKVGHLTTVGAISRVSRGGAIKGKSIFRHVPIRGGILYTCTGAYLFRPGCQSSRLESFGHAWEDTRIRLSHRGFSIKFTGTP